MKKIYYWVLVSLLGVMMLINLKVTLNGVSDNKLSMFNIDALGQIYDLGDLDEVTIRCAASSSNCFRSTGCRCYDSTLGYCPECGDYAYYCGYTGYTEDICGLVEIPILDLPWAHEWGCPYK